LPAAPGVFNSAPNQPQEQEIAEQVYPPTVHELVGNQLPPIIVMRNVPEASGANTIRRLRKPFDPRIEFCLLCPTQEYLRGPWQTIGRWRLTQIDESIKGRLQFEIRVSLIVGDRRKAAFSDELFRSIIEDVKQ